STLDDGRPGGFYLTRFRNLSEKHPKFIRGYGFEGGSGCRMFPSGTDVHGFGASFKEEVRKNQGAYIGMGAFGEVLARYENYVDLDPVVKDKWGIPALRFHYKFGDNEHRMAEDMKETAQEMFEAAGFEIVHVRSRVLTEGWSIHELGTARMGDEQPQTATPPSKPAARSAPNKPAGRFFTPAQHALVEELSETIIPADSHSGGAKAAKVADYIEQFLSETDDDNQKALWREGLRLVDLMSRHCHEKSCVDSGPEDRIGIMQC